MRTATRAPASRMRWRSKLPRAVWPSSRRFESSSTRRWVCWKSMTLSSDTASCAASVLRSRRSSRSRLSLFTATRTPCTRSPPFKGRTTPLCSAWRWARASGMLAIELVDPEHLLEEGPDLLPEETEGARHGGVEPRPGRRERVGGSFAGDGNDGVDRPRGNGGIDLAPPLAQRLGDEPGKILDEVPLRVPLARQERAEGFGRDVVGPPLA